MMSLIDDVKHDLEAGTDGPWRIVDCSRIGDRCTYYEQEIWSQETDILVTTECTRAHGDGGRVNIKRIARVPDLEAALLAADELAADFMITIDNIRDAAKTDLRWENVADKLESRLSTYRNAVEGK